MTTEAQSDEIKSGPRRDGQLRRFFVIFSALIADLVEIADLR